MHKYIIRKQLTKRPEDYPDAQNQPHVQVAIRRKAAHKGSGILPVCPTPALTVNGHKCLCGRHSPDVASHGCSVPHCLLLRCWLCACALPSRQPMHSAYRGKGWGSHPGVKRLKPAAPMADGNPPFLGAVQCRVHPSPELVDAALAAASWRALSTGPGLRLPEPCREHLTQNAGTS